MDYFYLFLGLGLLIVGADFLVKGAARLASQMGIPNLVIGLTVVAFGTSAPELAVSVNSALSNKTELAIANAVGSNIFNVLFILGLASIITALSISKQLIRQDVPIMILVSTVVFIMARDGLLSTGECLSLVVFLLAYITFLFIQGRAAEKETVLCEESENADKDEAHHPAWQSLLCLLIGLGLLVFGSNLLVNSAVNIARTFAVSEAVIGLTILAVGTSLPELLTSVLASFKGQKDIAVGNVVGSNTFNLLAVLGISGLFSQAGLECNPQLIEQGFPVMLAVAYLCFPLMLTGARLSRLEGALFFGLYILYTVFLIAEVKGASWLPFLQDWTWYFIFPTTLVIVSISLFSSFRQGNKSRDR